MKALIVESESRAGDIAESAMRAGGHETVRCHDPSWQSFPCTGMDGDCPVEGGVDVAILARNRSGHEPSPLEDGVRCAVRAGVPIVLYGPSGGNPYARWTAAEVPSGESAALVATAEATVAEPHALLSQAATSALIRTLENSGHNSRGAVGSVFRSAGGSRVVVDVAPDVPMDAARRAAVWVASAVRQEAGAGSIIDVVINHEDPNS